MERIIPYIMETDKCLKYLETTNQIISRTTFTKTPLSQNAKGTHLQFPAMTVPLTNSCRPVPPPVLRHEVACVAPGDPQTHLCDPGVTQLLSRDDTRDDTRGVARWHWKNLDATRGGGDTLRKKKKLFTILQNS